MHHIHLSPGTPPLLVLLLLALAGTLRSASAQACSCVTQTREQAFESAAAVFEGRVTEITRSKPDAENGSGRLLVSMLVVRAWKGVEVERVTVLTAGDGAACGYGFRQGESYLVYAYQGGAQPKVSLCSRTRPVAEAGEDLDALGMGVVPVQPVPTKEEKRAFSPDALPGPRPAGCASCAVSSAKPQQAWISSLLLVLWLAARPRARKKT
jgi:hypothetical protein